ncbi:MULTISPECIES: hypothetical protein [Pseudomonas]|uniref:Uncharacterized protein n=1 Tax=Pseudomonas syringae TaxID=317 RepID=A0A085VIS3_PSESX|nr:MULTISPECIES: hypothetical protein [Pseudomonas]KFE55336.1 hypothetical protein IV01_11950 [Pseudomonas syringae]MBK3453714.1 hypothetical protein [Pseudomonas sp. MF6754]
MEDVFKFFVVLGALCIAVNTGYFKNNDVQQGTVIEAKISAKDRLTDKERKESVKAFQNAANDCKSKDSYNERGSSMLQISHSFNFKSGSCEESKTLWTMQDENFWRNPEYLSSNVVIKTYTLPTNPYY